MSATPPPVTVRPGDLILVRAIAWWDSGQLKRVVSGILLSAAPILYDLVQRNTLTWRSALNAIVLGLFGYIGLKRAASPDVVTGMPTLDKGANAAKVVSILLADIQRANAAKPGAGG